jgi:hypothetical protein
LMLLDEALKQDRKDEDNGHERSRSPDRAG